MPNDPNDTSDRTGKALEFIAKMNKVITPKMDKFVGAFDKLRNAMKPENLSFVKATKHGEEFIQEAIKPGTKEVGNLADEMDNLAESVSRTDKATEAMEKGIKGLMGIETLSLWQGLSQKDALSETQEEVGNVTDELIKLTQSIGAGKAEFKALRGETFAMSKAFLESGIVAMPNEITAAMGSVADAGIRGVKEIKRMTHEVVLANKATGIATDELAEFFKLSEQQWGLGEDAGKKLINVASKVAEKYKISTGEVVSGLKALDEEISMVTMNMDKGMRETFTTGMAQTLGMMKEAGIEGGEELSKALLNIVADPAEGMDKMGPALANVGIGFEEASRMIKAGNMPELFSKAVKGMSQYTDAQGNIDPIAVKQLAEAFGMSRTEMVRMIDASKNLAFEQEQVTKNTDALNKSFNDQKELVDKAAMPFDRLSAVFDKMKVKVVSFGGALFNEMGGVVDIFGTFVQVAAPALFMAKQMGFGLDDVKKHAKSLTGIFSKSNNVLTKRNTLMGKNVVTQKIAIVTTKLWSAATWVLGTAMKVAMGPIGWIIGGIALLTTGVVLLIKYWDQLGPMMAKGMNYVAEFADKAINYLLALPKKISNFLESIPKAIEAMLTNKGSAAVETGFAKALKKVFPLLIQLGFAIGKFIFVDLGVILAKALWALGKVVVLLVKTGAIKLWDWWSGWIVNKVGSGFTAIIDTIKNVGSAIFDVITKPFKDAWNYLFGNTVWDFAALAEGITLVSESIFDAITLPFRRAWDLITGIWENIGPFIKQAAMKAWDLLPTIIKKPIEYLFGKEAKAIQTVQPKALAQTGMEQPVMKVDQTEVVDTLKWLGAFLGEKLDAQSLTPDQLAQMQSVNITQGGTNGNSKGMMELYRQGVL